MKGALDPRSLRALVEFLDFAPRHHTLAVDLSRRFLASQASHLPQGSGDRDYTERFFEWLSRRISPAGVPRVPRNKLRSPSVQDLRLIGLLDQYRAGGMRPAGGDCPLVHAAYSPGA
ncbi:MAG: hypothetical protein R3F33_09060 [Planctomycetota bacterium]